MFDEMTLLAFSILVVLIFVFVVMPFVSAFRQAKETKRTSRASAWNTMAETFELLPPMRKTAHNLAAKFVGVGMESQIERTFSGANGSVMPFNLEKRRFVPKSA